MTGNKTLKQRQVTKRAGLLIKLASVLALSLFALQTPAWADTLELYDGTVLSGTYLGGTRQTIRFDDGSQVLTFGRVDILALTIDGAGSGAVNQGDSYATEEPVLGRTIQRLPDPVTIVRVDGGLYYYHGGQFYQRQNRGYVIIEAPVGATIPFLPVARLALHFGGLDYFFFAGIYYQWRPWLGMYAVVVPPYGIYLHRPPMGSAVIVIGGVRYWRYGHRYYHRHRHGGGWRYSVVKRPPHRGYSRDRGQVSVMPILTPPGRGPSKGNSNYKAGRNDGRGRVAKPPSRGNSANNGRRVSGPYVTKPGNSTITNKPGRSAPSYSAGSNSGSNKGSSNYNRARTSRPSTGQPSRSAPSYNAGSNKGYSGGSNSIGQPSSPNPGRSAGGAGIRRLGG